MKYGKHPLAEKDMWKTLRRVVSETEGFFLRLSDDAYSVQSVLLFFPHGTVALLVMIWPGAKLETKQVSRIERFRDYGIPVYYGGSPDGVIGAVTAAAQGIDLGVGNCYP